MRLHRYEEVEQVQEVNGLFYIFSCKFTSVEQEEYGDIYQTGIFTD